MSVNSDEDAHPEMLIKDQKHLYGSSLFPSRNKQEIDQLVALSSLQSEVPISIESSVENQRKQVGHKPTSIQKSPLLSNIANKNINVKIMQKSDIKREALLKMNSKISRQNY